MFQNLKKWLSTKDDLAMYGDILGCRNWGGAPRIQWVEARDTAKHPTLHRTALHNKELANPKYQ